jgi:hypothetical protein
MNHPGEPRHVPQPACSPARRIQREGETFVRLTLLSLVVPFTVITDLVILGNRLGEWSVTEWAQALVLLVTTILCGDAARQEPSARGGYTLMAGFFACAFVREMDLVLDKLFFHGSWRLFAGIAMAAVLALAWRYRETILPGLATFLDRRAYPFFMIGLLIVIVLSRSLGSGRMLWNILGCDDTHRLFKTIIQESLESFGYLLITYGAFLLRREQDATRHA